MDKPRVRGTWALVTGSSSGLGASFARQLAARGCHLVLAARRKERLEQLAQALRREHRVEVDTVSVDLSARDAPASLHERLSSDGRAIEIVINNAGAGAYGRFLDTDLQRDATVLDLDVYAVLALTKLFGRDMVRRGSGYLLQVASAAAFQPAPLFATYAAAKTFVLHFGEALSHELRGTGVSCTVLAPGMTATEFFDAAGQKSTLFQRLSMMGSDQVARIGIEAMLQRKSSVVPGLLNSALTFSSRLMPRALLTASTYRLLGGE